MFRLRRASPPTTEALSIAGRNVEITRRAYKRSLGLTLKMNGTLRVSAPKGVSTARIREFVLSQESWIEKNLRKYESVRQAYPQKVLREGELLPYLGAQVPLHFEPCTTCKPSFKYVDGRIVCQVRREIWNAFDPSRPHPELLSALAQFYKKKARTVLEAAVSDFGGKMGVRPSALSFRAQKTRWGSCSSKGRISLNWKLMVAPPDVINYVVIHELAHLRYYNHSKSFWSFVETQDPEWRAHRSWLRENQFLSDFLASESELHPSNDLA